MKKLVLVLLFIIVITTIIFGIIGFYIATDKVDLTLLGDNNYKIEAFTNFKDDEIVVKKNDKILSNKKYDLKIISNLDESKVGKYTIKYIVKYHKKDYEIVRNVEVIDNVKPILDINVSEVEKDFCTQKIVTDIVVKANDNYDGDLTDKVIKTEAEDKLIYSVTDSSGNEDTKEIIVKVNKKKDNKFSLNGKNKLSIPLNGTYEEKGASYIDGCGKKIDKEIKRDGSVDTSKVGDYTISYSVEGEKTLTRTINVYEPVRSSKTIYLTFDDGPGGYTQNILNTLDKYNVKATFFVTNQFPGYSYLISEEANRGHKIAVHTYTHTYKVVYQSVDAYIDDFNKMNEIIKEKTGSYSNLYRFPGGSSNTVHCNYNKGVVEQIASEMSNRGYVYFDWNLSSGDAAGYSSTKIYNAVVNGVEGCSSCVVLMHDIKKTTADALDSILATLTSKGYNFATLNESSPTAHHSFGKCKN